MNGSSAARMKNVTWLLSKLRLTYYLVTLDMKNSTFQQKNYFTHSMIGMRINALNIFTFVFGHMIGNNFDLNGKA